MNSHPATNDVGLARPVTAGLGTGEASTAEYSFGLQAAAPALLVGVAWYVTVVLGYSYLLILAIPPVAVVWPPNVILLCGLLFSPVRFWWMHILAAAVAQLAGGWTVGVEFGRVVATFAGNVLQAMIGAGGMQACSRGPREFETVRGMTVFVVAALLLAPAIGALTSALLLMQVGLIEDLMPYWRVRFITGTVSNLTLLPPLLLVFSRRWRWSAISIVRCGELLAVVVLMFATEGVARSLVGPVSLAALLYVPLPFLLWAAIRFGSAGLALVLLANILVHCLGGVDVAWGASMEPIGRLLSVQLALIAAALPLLFLAVLFKERRRVEAKLRQSSARYALATTAGAVGVWEWNVQTNVVFVDAVLKQILGYADDEIDNRRQSWLRLLYPDEGDVSLRAAQPLIDGNESTYELERRMLHRDGSVRWFLERAAVVERDERGEILRIVGTGTDITDRKKAEEALREAAATRAGIERRSEMGELAATISHEVSQPLAAIVANASACLRWIVRGAADTPDVRQALADIMTDGKRAGEIVRRTRELFRHRSGERQRVAVNDLIHDSLALMRAKLARVPVQLELAAGLPEVFADPVQLQQVVCNLILNAVDAMRAVESRRPLLAVRSCTDGSGGVRVSLRDSGTGLTPEVRERLWEPFFTTKRNGMGIGLAVCRSIVEAHGGRLWEESSDTPGATFHFSLPAMEEGR